MVSRSAGLQASATTHTEDKPTLLTARNDGLINSFNPVQPESPAVLHQVSEPRSQSLKDHYRLQEGNNSLKAVQKLLINTVGERDYSAQETSHLLLQLPMFKASRDFIILSLDGSHAVQDHLDEGQHATALSIVDHYMGRPDSPHFDPVTLLEFARKYSVPKTLGAERTPRRRHIVVIPRPYTSPYPAVCVSQYCTVCMFNPGLNKVNGRARARSRRTSCAHAPTRDRQPLWRGNCQ